MLLSRYWPSLFRKKPYIPVAFLLVTVVIIMLPPLPQPADQQPTRTKLPAHLMTALRLPLFLKDVAPNPQASNIYQLVTSNPAKLKPRQYCSLESYCRKNPASEVWSLLLGEGVLIEEPSMWLRMLQNNYLNLHLARLDLTITLQDTPLESIANSGELQSSSYPPVHLSDVLSMAVVSKVGGLYSDFDFLCLSSVATIRNTMALAKPGRLMSGIFHFDAGHPLLQLIMEAYLNNYNNKNWDQSSPLLFSKTAKRNCPSFDFLSEEESSFGDAPGSGGFFGSVLNLVSGGRGTPSGGSSPDNIGEFQSTGKRALVETSTGVCTDVALLLDTRAFAPFNESFISELFKTDSSDYLKEVNESTYALHLFNKVTGGLEVELGAETAMEELFWRDCPVVYELASLNNIAL